MVARFLSKDHPVWNLELCVRRGLYPENPVLLDRYIGFGKERLKWSDSNRIFQIILATVCDSSVPSHWRRTCLENAYKPLVAMRLFAESDGDRAATVACEDSLRRIKPLL